MTMSNRAKVMLKIDFRRDFCVASSQPLTAFALQSTERIRF